MKSSWRSPDGGSSVTPNTKIEPSEAVFCAWWSTASTPIRSFHTVSPRLYEKVSNTDEPPRHEANHRSVHERFSARTKSLVIFAHLLFLVDPRAPPPPLPPSTTSP